MEFLRFILKVRFEATISNVTLIYDRLIQIQLLLPLQMLKRNGKAPAYYVEACLKL